MDLAFKIFEKFGFFNLTTWNGFLSSKDNFKSGKSKMMMKNPTSTYKLI